MLLATVAGLAGTALAVRLGALRGRRPQGLGATDGALGPVRTDLNNAVSSRADTAPHRIAPIDASPDPVAAFARLRDVVTAMPGATVIEARDGYLYAEFETRWMRFVDDVEFLLDGPGRLIHVRSASRLGQRDFGVNRARIEAIRARLATG